MICSKYFPKTISDVYKKLSTTQHHASTNPYTHVLTFTDYFDSPANLCGYSSCKVIN